MHAVEFVSPVSKQGQVTLPDLIRTVLGIPKKQSHSKNAMVGFRIEGNGKVSLLSVEINERTPYTKEEWEKIEKLANQKGKLFSSARAAKRYVESLPSKFN